MRASLAVSRGSSRRLLVGISNQNVMAERRDTMVMPAVSSLLVDRQPPLGGRPRQMTTRAGMPEIIEKWGRGPFYKTSASLIVFSLGCGIVFDSPLVTAVLGLPTAVFTVVGLRDLQQKEHTLLRNFPVLGHMRYLFEAIRPEIRQYFVESE